MLHELLLALSGYPGGIFVKSEDGKIEIVKDLPFINPSEVALLSRLCRLASHYDYFITFIAKYGHTAHRVDESSLHGLYVKAVCQGLDSVLQPYRDTLLDLEKQALSDPHITAASFQSELEEYQMLFPALRRCLEEIRQHNAQGCYILEILYRSAVNGIPQVANAINRMLHICHGVMYKQLSAWMLHGMLLDKYSEFFIQKEARGLTDGSSVQVDEDELGLGGVTGRQLQQIMHISSGFESSSSAQFSICVEKLPSYIPTRVANKILFVGESVQMFETNTHTSGPGGKYTTKGSILQKREDEFSKDLHALSRREMFDLMEFETTIDKIRSYAAEQLWKLIVEESDLPGHLRIMKDFYLLGRGELFLAFIDQAHPLLRTVPKGQTEHDVNMAFQHAARDVLFEDDKLLQRFNLTVEVPPQDTHDDTKTKRPPDDNSGSSTDSGWNLLKLQYKVEWPLHLLFTPNVLDRYNRLLHFLLHVKRVQLELQQCWALQMQRKHLATLRDSNATQWWLRNHMAFLIDNLQYYLQVDVIESQFSVLQDRIQNTPDFEEIRLAHDTFITSLLSQSFLLMKPISHCLGEILHLCHSFCGLMMQSDIMLTEQQLGVHDEITKNFQRQSSLLFQFLSSVRSHQASPHLAQLLLRIDYNKYFTVAGGQLGSYKMLSSSSDIMAPSSRRN